MRTRKYNKLESHLRSLQGDEVTMTFEAVEGVIASNLPPTLILMILIIVALFNSIRQPAVIFLTVPLGLIGVSAGLLAFGAPFGFMALLGLVHDLEIAVQQGVGFLRVQFAR